MAIKRFILPINASGTIQNLRTTSVTQTTIALAWDAYLGATAYQIYRSTTQGSLGTLLATPTATPTPTYTNSGHTAGTTYYYTVRPVVGGSGVASAQASIVVITSSAGAVSVVGNTLVLSHSGFGSKAVVEPTFFAPLASNADGQTAQAVGLNLYNTEEVISPATACVVTSARTLGQSKSLVWRGYGQTYAQNTAVPIFAIHLPANAQSVLISGWFNVSRIGSLVGGIAQLKMHRTGVYGAGSVSNANNHYSASPHESCSIFMGSDITWLPGLNYAGFNSYADLEDTIAASAQFNNPDPMISGVDSWWHYQTYMRYTDIGQANGEFSLWINNTLIANRTGLTNRTLGTQFYQWASVFTGFQMIGRDWDVYFTRPYIDVNTRAHIWLGNAATQSACTGRYLLNPTAWNDSQITATGVDSRPAGYNWVYVTNDSAVTNSNGYAI